MIIVGTLLILLAVGAVFLAIAGPGMALRRRARTNLTRGLDEQAEDHLGVPRPSAGLRALLLPANLRWLERSYVLAGRPSGWAVPRVVALKPVIALGAALLPFLLFLMNGNGWLLLLTVVAIVVGYFVPDLLLHSRGTERQTEIGLELPDTLDQMLISVEAGLGFDAAVSRAAVNGKGPLAEELARTLQDMRVGIPRRDAYQDLAGRTTSPDVRAFIRAVVQADTYGVSISGVLRVQAKEMRMKRRQRAEQKAMTVPVKVLFPLMLLILPVLFITVLGPTVIGFLT